MFSLVDTVALAIMFVLVAVCSAAFSAAPVIAALETPRKFPTRVNEHNDIIQLIVGHINAPTRHLLPLNGWYAEEPPQPCGQGGFGLDPL